jgi:hypothetical protein
MRARVFAVHIHSVNHITARSGTPTSRVSKQSLRAPKSLWVIRSEHCRIGTIGATCRRFASRLAYYLPVARWSPSPSAAFLHSNLPCFVCPNSLSPSTG